MKKALTLIAIAALLTGCGTLNKVMRITQEFEGDGSITVITRFGTGTANVVGARQENGRFHAEKLNLVVNEGLSGTKIEIHAEPYSRALIEGK